MSEHTILFLTMVGTALTALATVGLVILAGMALKPARDTLQQMKDDSEAQTRPYLHAWLTMSIAGAPTVDLVVRNAGQSAAYNVRGTLDALPQGPYDVLVEGVPKALATPRTLPPGTDVRVLWWMGPRKTGTSPQSSTGFDQDRVITLTYSDRSGKQYEEDVLLANLPDATPLPTGGRQWMNTTREEKKMIDLIKAVNSLRY